jgi:RNA methyltransferase, TrmH family
MLTNKQIKLINSLHSKKGRSENRLFLVEGEKGINELLNSNLKIHSIIINDNIRADNRFVNTKCAVIYVSDNLLHQLSTLITNNFGIAIVEMPNESFKHLADEYTVVLDGIRDPGNLGTIIRICDWYGINQIVLSNDCTEFYNPKVISASMGSFSRISHIYVQLDTWLSQFTDSKKIGALLNGTNIHEYKFPSSGFIIFGNESNGIGQSVIEMIDDYVTIPSFGGAESLNVGISCAIFLDNLRRN